MKLGICALIEAKPGKEDAVAQRLSGAVALAREESGTLTWYAFRAGPRSFGIFDTFADEAGRKAHLEGRIAQALLGKAEELLSQPPDIKLVDLLASK